MCVKVCSVQMLVAVKTVTTNPLHVHVKRTVKEVMTIRIFRAGRLVVYIYIMCPSPDLCQVLKVAFCSVFSISVVSKCYLVAILNRVGEMDKTGTIVSLGSLGCHGNAA